MSESKSSSGVAPNPLLVLAVLASVQLSFSGWHIVGKKSLEEGMNPYVFALYRECLASCLMWITARWKDGPIAIHRCDLPRFVMLGVLSFCNVVGYVVALAHVTAANSAMTQPSIPVFSLVFASLLGYEVFTWNKAVGILLAVGGCVTITLSEMSSHSDDGQADNPVLGNVILVCQCAAMGLLYVLQKPIVSKYPAATSVAAFYSIGSLITVVVCVATADSSDYKINEDMTYIALTYATLVSTFYNYNALAWAIQFVKSSTVSLFSSLQTVTTTVLSLIFLHSHLEWLDVLGAALVVGGMVITLLLEPKVAEEVAIEGDLEERLLGGGPSMVSLTGAERDDVNDRDDNSLSLTVDYGSSDTVIV